MIRKKITFKEKIYNIFRKKIKYDHFTPIHLDPLIPKYNKKSFYKEFEKEFKKTDNNGVFIVFFTQSRFELWPDDLVTYYVKKDNKLSKLFSITLQDYYNDTYNEIEESYGIVRI